MSDTSGSLSRKIRRAGDLQAVVRTMKALAASSIGQYEQSVRALGDYYRTVELGLGVCLREMSLLPRPTNGGIGVEESPPAPVSPTGSELPEHRKIGAVVFGSDQGLVGQFNEVVADYALKALAAMPGKPEVWAVGERVHACLVDAGLTVQGLFPVPTSVKAITPLVGEILVEHEALRVSGDDATSEFTLFYNRSTSVADKVFAPVGQRLLPLDANWQRDLAALPWPSPQLPEIVVGEAARVTTLRGLIREYLFVSLFRACAESLASENASRLAAMERADRNIDDLLEEMNSRFHQLRQSSIDAELFDVIAGFEALGGRGKTR
jgi:F-type H+-transporting ATPase subunit gamma